MRIYLFFFIIIFSFYFLGFSEGFTNEQKKENYNELRQSFSIIFPESNRNAGGPQYINYLVNNCETHDEFSLKTKMFCGVSGSLLNENIDNTKDIIMLYDYDGNKHFGYYHRCCIPCNCDIMRCGKIENIEIEINGIKKGYKAITITDPCNNNKLDDISEVNSFICENNITKNAIKTDKGNIIVAILHDFNDTHYSNNQYINNIEEYIKNHENTKNCSERNEMKPEELRFGMGDIFVRLCES